MQVIDDGVGGLLMQLACGGVADALCCLRVFLFGLLKFPCQFDDDLVRFAVDLDDPFDHAPPWWPSDHCEAVKAFAFEVIWAGQNRYRTGPKTGHTHGGPLRV